VIPDVQYAKTSDGANVAYQVAGKGPVDVVFAVGWFSNLDLIWEQPEIEPFLRRLAERNRLILFDRRGTGLSDAMIQVSDLDTMIEDVVAVMDAAGSERAVLVGTSISAGLMAVFAASFPERTLGLVMIHALARNAWAPDYPWGETKEFHREETEQMAAGWGTGEFERWFLAEIAHDPRADDLAYVARLARYTRNSMSRGAAAFMNRVWIQADYRHVLPSIHVPTLIVERRPDPSVSEHLAGMIPGAQIAHLVGEPRLPWVPGTTRTADEIQRFVEEIEEEQRAFDRVLATVLFTDVVDSTGRGAELGDTKWSELLAEHNRIVRAALARYRGKEVKTMGDGFLATFDAPARAIRCAQAIARSSGRAGVDVRAGIHTGECTIEPGGDISGLAVAIAARVSALAGPNEVLASGTVRDLVAGSGLEFEDRGEHELKGVPGTWRLFGAGVALPEPGREP
jgi:class 3 adenylate cyclase